MLLGNHCIYLKKFPFLNPFVCLHLQEKFAGVDIRVRVNGGGHVAQIYAIRQSISKALVSFYQKCKCIFISSRPFENPFSRLMVSIQFCISKIAPRCRHDY